MAIQSWMRACLCVTVLTATCSQSEKLAAQEFPTVGPVVDSVPQATEASEPARQSVTQPPRRFPTPEAVVPAGFQAAPDNSAPAASKVDSPSTSPDLLSKLRLDTKKAEGQLKELFPKSRIFLIQHPGKLIVKGQAESKEEKARILQVVKSLVSSHAKESSQTVRAESDYSLPEDFIIDLIHFEEVTVSLNVKAVELDRKKMRNLGFDFKLPAPLADSAPAVSLAMSTDALTGLFPSEDISANVSALVEAGLAKIVAEPTLVVQDGHAASFISGVPTPTFVGVGGPVGATSFRGYGTSLLVLPSAIDKDYLKLEVTSEFSTILSDGFRSELPELDVRRSTATVKMREGHSFALTTEFEQAVVDDSNQIPFLGELPVIGPAFRKKPKTTTRELLLVITPTIAPADPSTSRLPQVETLAAVRTHEYVPGAVTEHYIAVQPGENSDPWQRPSRPVVGSYEPLPTQSLEWRRNSWNSETYWLPEGQLALPRLTHLQTAYESLIAAGLSAQAKDVQKEIRKQKLEDQRRALEQKKKELAALQAEVDALGRAISLAGKEQPRHFRLNSLVFRSTLEEFSKAGLILKDRPEADMRIAKILDSSPDVEAILQKCRQATRIEVLGTSTQIVANGERTSWQNGVEVAVPEVVQTSANTESTTATGFRLIGSDIILTPSLSDDGQISVKSVFGFSERRKSEQGLVQVGHHSVPEIESRRTNTEMKLTSGQTIVLGMPESDGTMVVLVVKVTVDE